VVTFVAGKEIGGREVQPLVSIITPFYNTARYLAECIESVLAQTYSNWEYILINNQSTDSSRRIAESYAQKDGRIRLADTPQFYGQIENFNRSFGYMSRESRYCKIVLADDLLFPECVERMIALAEANPSVGIVSSYRLFGDEVSGGGLPYSNGVIPGREACRRMIVDNLYLTGSPTSVLFRADIVRGAYPFYPEDSNHDDTDACFRVLAEHDLGFVHQVLSFSRKDDDSILSKLFAFGPGPLRRFMFAKMYGSKFLSEEECRRHLRRSTDFYGKYLAESVFEFNGKEFWDFHRRGLRAAGASFGSIGLPKYVFFEVLDILLNPKKTAGRIARFMRRRKAEPKG